MASGRAALLRLIGPGVLVAATGVGAGDLATASIAGSKLGPAILWAARLLPFLIVPTCVLALLDVLWSRGIVPPPGGVIDGIASMLARGWWAPPLVAGIVLSALVHRAVSGRINAALSHLGGLEAYGDMLAHVESSAFASPRLAAIRARLGTGAPGRSVSLSDAHASRGDGARPLRCSRCGRAESREPRTREA